MKTIRKAVRKSSVVVSLSGALLLVSTGALADIAFISSDIRRTDQYCRLDWSNHAATPSAPIPAGSVITSIAFTASDGCDPQGCYPGQFNVDFISICLDGFCRTFGTGTFHDFDNRDPSRSWTTGVVRGAVGCDTSVSWAFSVTYNPPVSPPPRVDSLPIVEDRTAGGRTIYIYGANFAPGAIVGFGTSQSPSVQYINPGLLYAVTPPHPPGRVRVTVTVNGQTGTWPGQFLYVDHPTVLSVAPDHGRIAGGEDVTITGTNLSQGQGSETFVSFGLAQATNVRVVNGTTMVATTPAHDPGPVAVSVQIYTASGSLNNAFTYYPSPTVIAVSPPSGPDAGGTSVTITGTNFDSGATVTFGGVPATRVTFVSTTTLQAMTPAHPIGPVDVSITVHDQTGSMSNAFRYYSTAQIISVLNSLFQ